VEKGGGHRTAPNGTVTKSSVKVDLILSGESTGNRTGRRTNRGARDNRATNDGCSDRPDSGTNTATLKRPCASVRATRRKGKRGNT